MEIKLYIRDLKCSKDKGNYIISKENYRKKETNNNYNTHTYTHTPSSRGFFYGIRNQCAKLILKKTKT